MIPPNENWLRSSIIMQVAIACGAEFAIISPGSRNTPLSHTAILQNDISCYINIDERSAGFTALGIGKASNKPVVLICTSGTAAANYYPAIAEANLSRIPLIILTADRPTHLQNRGAPQTMFQSNLYGSHVKCFLNVAERINDYQALDEFIESIIRAVQPLFSTGIGPIHLNCPFDEPLQPIERDSGYIRLLWDKAANIIAEKLPLEAIVNIKPDEADMSILEHISKQNSVFILAGPGTARNLSEVSMFEGIADTLNAPVFADMASAVRHLSNCVKYPDLIYTTTSSNRYNSGTILWFGGYPTSKRLSSWLKCAETVYRVQEHDQIVDPDRVVKSTIHVDISSFNKMVKSSGLRFTRNINLEDVKNLDNKISKSLSQKYSSEDYPLDLSACATVLSILPKGSNLVLANSMSIRYLDSFCALNREVSVFANKGVNGIDGTISTATGVAIATGKPTVLIIGDLAFLHDLNALALVRTSNINLTILLLNNNGGGIFHYLPSHDALKSFDTANHIKCDSFEAIQGTPQHIDSAHHCKGFGISYIACRKQSDLSILKACVSKKESVVLEIFCDRTVTHKYVVKLNNDLARL